MPLGFREVERATRDACDSFMDTLREYYNYDFENVDPLNYNQFVDNCIEYVFKSLENFIKEYHVTMRRTTVFEFDIVAECEEDVYNEVTGDPNYCEGAENIIEYDSDWEIDEISEA